MGKRTKTILKVSIGIVLGTIVLIFVLQWVLKSKIENYLDNNFKAPYSLAYNNLDLNLFSGNVALHAVDLKYIGKTTNKLTVRVQLDKLTITNFSYWSYLINSKISMSEIQLKSPNVTYYHNKKIHKKSYKTKTSKQLNKSISSDRFIINDAKISVFNAHTDSLLFMSKNTRLLLNNLVYNAETKNHKIPFKFANYELQLDSVFYKLSQYDNLKFKQASITESNSTFNQVSLKTKYSKEQLSQLIPVERDHYNLTIDSVSMKAFRFGFRNDSILQIKNSKLSFYQPNIAVFRDKLVADDTTIKPLYSSMLRNLNFDLSVDTVSIIDANIDYSEKVKKNREAGLVTFNAFNATIKNLSNTYLAPTKTTLDVHTEFMNHAPLQANWEFDVNDITDRFMFQANIGLLEASYLNSFTKPNLNIELEGKLDKTYLTINADRHLSNVDFKVKYDNFDVVALKENGNEKNTFLSDVINLFVSKNSVSNKSPFIEVTKKEISRNKNQSVFNYLWINARAGLLKAMTIEKSF